MMSSFDADSPVPSSQPSLRTERLVLRPFDLDDCARVRELAGDQGVSEMVEMIPHPYPEGLAAKWIVTHADIWRKQSGVVFAIESSGASKRELIGAVSLMNVNQGVAEIGMWIGVPYWGQGFMTEALREHLQFCFDQFEVDLIYGRCFTKNPASAQVQLKVGMKEVETRLPKQRRFEIQRSQV